MEYKNLLFAVEDGVAIITFNRPKALNAMNSETMKELYDAVIRCKNDETIKAIILTGSGEKAFVAGADISEMKDLRPKEALAFMELGHETLRALETLPKPSIAAVNGFALGGGTEISMACDMRFASETARFGQPEILIGLIPGWGGTQRLPRLVGMGRAKELIMGGEQIDAKRAYEIGLVNQVFPADQLLDAAKKFAKKLAGLPGFAIKMAKHSINYGYDLALDNANRLETECCAQCFSTDDQKEGMTAFLEKRKPNFKGQ
ncbi:MAG: enoyl-CoA hydratase/isomerase family protein [Syntrophobacterales bacterium]|nr:enoyl-CoA hydratase/isomerase family protein [Syntrophobacterales bacterium]